MEDLRSIPMEELRSVRLVSYTRNNWVTNVNPKVTDEELKAYFLHKTFNLSTATDEEEGKERLEKVEKIEVLDHKTGAVAYTIE